MSKLKEAVRDAMWRYGISQNAIADRAGMNRSSLSMLMNGKRKMSETTIVKLCKVLDCTPNDIVEVDDD